MGVAAQIQICCLSHGISGEPLSFLLQPNNPIFLAYTYLMLNLSVRPLAMKVSGYWLLSLLKKQFLCTHRILISHQIHQAKLRKVQLMLSFIWNLIFSMFRICWVHNCILNWRPVNHLFCRYGIQCSMVTRRSPFA